MSTVVPAHAVLERYDGFLLDAYGVLVDGDGPLPHAAAFVQTLDASGKEKLLLSNDASRTRDEIHDRLRGFGLAFAPDEILSSGMMIEPWVRHHGFEGAPAVVLGPEGSQSLATEAGLRQVSAQDTQARVVLVCDEAGFPFVETIEALLQTLITRTESGRPTALVLPNPDVLYPKAGGAVGITAGAAACVIERGLQARFGADAAVFERLGKPHAPIFDAALQHIEGRVLMVGDQLETDVLGALGAGLDVALIETGVGRRPPPEGPVQPTWVLESLEL